MYKNKILSMNNLRGFDFKESKKNIHNYFTNLENLEWEWTRLNTQKGLIANHDLSIEYNKQPYVAIGKDIFNLSAKELTEEKLKECIASYYWARSILSDEEQLYIMEHFINEKYEDEIIDLLGFNNRDTNEFKRLKRSAVYKFADFLNLLVEKKRGKLL